MFLLDRLLVGGIRFVLDKLAQAADAELNDVDSLRTALLEVQMRRELEELPAEEAEALEAAILARLREIEQRRRAEAGSAQGPLPPDARIAGVEISFGGEEHAPSAAASPEPLPEPPSRPPRRRRRRGA